jgi:hypothetical protein
MSDEPHEKLQREIDEIFSDPNPQAPMERRLRDSQQQAEREHLALMERLRVQRENNPRYWKGLYENLLAKIEEERQDHKRRQDTLWGLIIASGVVAAVLFIIERVW